MYLSDDNLADDDENITEPKRKRRQKLLTVSPSSKKNDSSITKLNRSNTFWRKKIYWKVLWGWLWKRKCYRATK